MRTTSHKKSLKARPSSKRTQAKLAVQRVDDAVTRHLPKPRTGFASLVEPVARLIAKYGDVFGPGIDVELMRSSLRAYQALESDYENAINQLAKIENTRLVHASTAWSQILLAYNRGQSLARTSVDIKADIKPIAEFMKIGPRKPHAAATPPVATTTP
jgi:hypothetical protein